MIKPDQIITVVRCKKALRNRGGKNLILAEGRDAVRIIPCDTPAHANAEQTEPHKIVGVFTYEITISELREQVAFVADQVREAA